MANLVKITNVTLLANYEDTDSYYCNKLLEDNSISHNKQIFINKDDANTTLVYYSLFVYGDSYSEYNFTSLPLIIWMERYDDYERWYQVANNSSALANSNLIIHKDLVTTAG